ncbi:MAG: hypothetical protein WC916_03435 [Candidatus Woesearchaeota archaeon]
MSLHAEFDFVKHHPKYPYAKSLLEDLLRHKEPSREVLKELYPSLVDIALRNIILFYADPKFTPGEQLRQHPKEKYTELYDASVAIESHPAVQAIESDLINRMLPEIDTLQGMYRAGAVDAYAFLKFFVNRAAKRGWSRDNRECGIPEVTHYQAVANTVFALGFDGDNPRPYKTLTALMHDGVEGGVARLEEWNQFIKKYIPKEIRKSVLALTNKYNFIALDRDHHLKDKGLRFDKENFINSLYNIDFKQVPWVETEVQKLREYIKDVEDVQDFKAFIKYHTYDALYLEDMYNDAVATNDFSVLDIKEIDIWRNSEGKEALNMAKRIGNTNKQIFLVDKVKRVAGKWAPLDRHNAENEEDALSFSEDTTIAYLIHSNAQQRFKGSAFEKIRRLAPVFYTDYKRL